MTLTTPIHDLLSQARARRDYYVKLVDLLEPLIAQLSQSQDTFAREVSILTPYPQTPEVAVPPPPTPPTPRTLPDRIEALLAQRGPLPAWAIRDELVRDGWNTTSAKPLTVIYQALTGTHTKGRFRIAAPRTRTSTQLYGLVKKP